MRYSPRDRMVRSLDPVARVVGDGGALEQLTQRVPRDADAASEFDAGQADSAAGGTPLSGERVRGVPADAEDGGCLLDGEHLSPTVEFHVAHGDLLRFDRMSM